MKQQTTVVLASAMFAYLTATFGAVAQADITLAKIFTDHMVLQQQSRIQLWGTADPNTTLIVSFLNEETETVVRDDGTWSTSIVTREPGGPHRLEVRSQDGQKKVVLSDVLIGEVWICSGQSNMQWTVTASAHAEREIEMSRDFSSVRLFTVEPRADTAPQSEFGKVRGWDVCGPDTVGSFSAVAYSFGRELHRELKVPIGLINTSLGGTRAEAWTSRAALEADEAFAPLLRHWDQDQDLTSVHRPGNLYNAMIAPLKGTSFRGAIWYQGESNVGRGHQYRRLFPTLIENWRRELAAGEPFPFYFVQIAPFRYSGRDPVDLPELWDAQLQTFRDVPEVGMVVTTDITDLNDIHPANKQDVGRRLAWWAISECYAHGTGTPGHSPAVIPSGPIFREMESEGGRIRLRFDYAEGGLIAKDDLPLTEFTICGEDRNFVAAQARIEGEELIVWSDQVAEPVAVRFAWTDTAQPNLFNRAGLPASPFRTDSFELTSQGREF